MNTRAKITRLGFAALLVLGVAAAGTGPIRAARSDGAGRPATVAAASQVETPGALQILDKQGRPAAVCPLKHTDVVADIAGYVARVTVTQEFGNPSSTPVEAVYTFPLPEDAAVDDMTMVIGKRIVRGMILRKEQAREVYEDAKARGQAAALLDQERPNIFTQSVANIMPGDGVKITISYVNLLKYEEGLYEFTFPMVVGPRYTPGGGYQSPGLRGAASPAEAIGGDPGAKSVVTDAHKITPPITPKGTRAGHDISVTVNLDAGLPIQQVKSALHEVTTNQTSRSAAVIKLKDRAAIPNKDFVLRYSAAGSQVSEGILTYAPPGGHGGYFTLVIQPPAAPPKTMVSPKEMVFVIDQTGSQSGWPIRKSKETMAYCIRNLNPGDTFQLIGFNTSVYPCFDAPVHATEANIDKALKWMEPLEGQGGTDILKSVDYALKIPEDPGRLRIVCYMTDGYVGNDMQIIDAVGKHRGQARMFPFGIGNSVNRFLIEGMAREGKGASDYVFLDAPGTAHAAKFYRRVAGPVLLDVGVDFGTLPVADVYPRAIPDVFTSKPVIVKGRYTRAAEGDIIVRGLLRGKPWSRTIHVRLPEVDPQGSSLATLWAREKIEDLQSQDWLGAQTGKPKTDTKDKIIELALEYRLMSQYTSFVAVEQRVVNVGGKQRTVDVPVEMPDGVDYAGIFGVDRESEGLARKAQVARFGLSKQNRAFGVPAQAQGGMGGGGRGTVSLGKGTWFYSPPAPASASTSLSLSEARMPAIRTMKGDKGSPPISSNLALGLNDHYRTGGRLSIDTLGTLTPLQRRSVLRAAKLDSALQAKLAKGAKGRIEIQVWLSKLPADGLKKLKAAGFDLAAVLKPGRLLLGSIGVDRLDGLLALEFVRAAEAPRMR